VLQVPTAVANRLIKMGLIHDHPMANPPLVADTDVEDMLIAAPGTWIEDVPRWKLNAERHERLARAMADFSMRAS
jgi:hypothetical protein